MEMKTILVWVRLYRTHISLARLRLAKSFNERFNVRTDIMYNNREFTGSKVRS